MRLKRETIENIDNAIKGLGCLFYTASIAIMIIAFAVAYWVVFRG